MGAPQSIPLGRSRAAEHGEPREEGRAGGGRSYATVVAKLVLGVRKVAPPPPLAH